MDVVLKLKAGRSRNTPELSLARLSGPWVISRLGEKKDSLGKEGQPDPSDLSPGLRRKNTTRSRLSLLPVGLGLH